MATVRVTHRVGAEMLDKLNATTIDNYLNPKRVLTDGFGVEVTHGHIILNVRLLLTPEELKAMTG